MRIIPINRGVIVVGLSSLILTACGVSNERADGDRPRTALPQVVVTTDILGDIVGEVVGDLAEVEVIMPSGSSPHDFQASARQAETMENADLLITNGAGFEAGMTALIEGVADAGTAVFAFADAVDLRTLDEPRDDAEARHDDHADEATEAEHEEAEAEAEAEHGGDDNHEAEGLDPHLWTDPQMISTALKALEPLLAELDDIDSGALAEQFGQYLGELQTLTTDIDQTLSVIPPDRRVLVTNHEVFGYFSDRFDLRVVGTIIPALTTDAEPSAAGMDELIDVIEAEAVPAIFVESTQSTRLADAIAGESGDAVEVIQLFSESLGEIGSGADTYLTMMRTNASLIAGALEPRGDVGQASPQE